VELNWKGFPVVVSDKPLQAERLPSALLDIRASAASALECLRGQGQRQIRYRIPGDVAVAGYDDDPIAAVFDPSLATIYSSMYEMGRRSFDGRME
jgi:DNA-binding LacI/PurR family transcriptional regulator